ncbi:hypothetical protein WAI453_000273 [Rhynchosporium graminicola]
MKDTGAAAAQSTCYEPQCYPISPVIKKDPAAYNEVLVAVREMSQARLLQNFYLYTLRIYLILMGRIISPRIPSISA